MWERDNSLRRCSEYKTTRNVQGFYFYNGVNWEVIIDWDHASFLSKNYYLYSNNTWLKHWCWAGEAEICMFLDATFHLAVKILAPSHFGGNMLEGVRSGYGISSYLTMLWLSLQSFTLHLPFVAQALGELIRRMSASSTSDETSQILKCVILHDFKLC